MPEMGGCEVCAQREQVPREESIRD
jgi:hypothetical protein